MLQSTMPKGFANLGKPVTLARFENAMSHMADMRPDMSKEQQREIVKAAQRLIEQDNPDALWGHVDAHPPLKELCWVSRMRLGAALLAE